MSTVANPYAPPSARVEDIHHDHGTQPIRLWSARGRIGRLRFLAWSIIGSLVIMPVAFIAGMVGAVSGLESLTYALLGLAYIGLIVFIALLTIQRSHDIGWSGWVALLALIPLVSLVFLFVRGSPGTNRFGAPPPANPRGLGWLIAVPIFLFVLGIVAAIALPAYQSYTLKARAAQSQGK